MHRSLREHLRVRLSRLPLPALFGAGSLLVIAVVAAALHVVLAGVIEDRAVQHAVRSSQFVARVGLEPVLGDTVARGSLGTGDLARIDRALAFSTAGGVLTGLDVLDRSGRVVYSDAHASIGTRTAPGSARAARLRQVLADGVARPRLLGADGGTGDATGDAGPRVAVLVPLHEPGRQQVVGAAELYVPFEPVQRDIAEDTRRVVGVLLGGLAVLWLALLRLVVSVSRRLRRQVQHNEHQARHDALTGLPNRTLLFERLADGFDSPSLAGRRPATGGAVLLLDLNRFKEVNDTLGHHNGDRLLQHVAVRFAAVLRSSDTLARLGGDEFAALLPGVDERGAVAVARRMAAALEAPVQLDGLDVSVGASVGVALAPDHGDTAELLLQRADVAMYQAKRSSQDVVVYCGETDDHDPQRLTLLGDLRLALQREELVLHYQPQADSRTGVVRGLEALLRWQHPQRGTIGPAEFVPLLESSGLIDQVTPYVIERALRERAAWAAHGHDVPVAVNVSPRNVVDRSFPAQVARLLRAAAAPPGRLVLEITEDALLSDPGTALAVLLELKELGVRLSVDDYGSGYSSLAYLQTLPVDELKIDRRFVQHVGDRRIDRAIVRSTVDLGRDLGVAVVAEGVEDDRAWRTLAELQCDTVQGYHLSRPLPRDAVLAWLDARADGGGRAQGVPRPLLEHRA